MNVQKKVVEILMELSGLTKIKKTDRLMEELSLDSLAMVTLLVEAEDQFGIEFLESDMNPFDLRTVEDVIHLVEKYGGGSNGIKN